MSDKLSADLHSLRIDREARPPRSYGWLIALVVVAILSGVGAIASRELEPMLFKTEVAVTEVSLVSPAQGSVELAATGYVVPQKWMRVSSKLLSRIVEVRVKEGDKVKQGDFLFRVDDSEYRAAASAAKKRLAAARARALSARAALDETKGQLAREKSLAQQGVLAEGNAQDRDAEMRSREEAWKAALADADAAAEDLAQREAELSWASMNAPIDGVVIGKPLDVGEMVGTFTEKPVVELADFDSFLVEIDIPEQRLGKVRKTSPCEIVLDAYPDRRFRGEVAEIGTRINRAKATITIKVKFVDKADVALPDMAARVNLLGEKLEAAQMKEPPKLFAPKGTVVDRAGAQVVFQVDDGRVRVVPVQVAGAFGTGFHLRAGPPAGTKVVQDPPPTLADGQRIKEK